jgi:CHAT domain-containing protein
VRSKLRPDEVLLEYVMAKPTSFCLVLTRERARLVQLPSSAEIEPLIDAELKALKTPEKPSPQPARNLYRVLLGQIAETRAKSRIVAVPDGRLHLVPFSALIDESDQFLVTSHVISYAPIRSKPLLAGNETFADPNSITLSRGRR